MKLRKPKFYFCDVWKMNYYFCLGWPDKMIETYMKNRFHHTTSVMPAAGKLFECEYDTYNISIIWIRRKDDFTALVHECVHAANFTLRCANWKADMNNDEPQAYLVENIFRQATKRR